MPYKQRKCKWCERKFHGYMGTKGRKDRDFCTHGCFFMHQRSRFSHEKEKPKLAVTTPQEPSLHGLTRILHYGLQAKPRKVLNASQRRKGL